MPRRTIQIELPRRLTAYFLLFGVVAVLWCALGLVLVAQQVVTTRAEKSCLSEVHRVASKAGLHYLQGGERALQDLVKQVAAEGPVLYCAVVSPEGRCLAHTARDQVGRQYFEPPGQHAVLGEVVRVRFLDENSQRVREYRTALKSGSQEIGRLHLAVAEPNIWSTARVAAEHAPLLALGSTLLLGIGAFCVYRSLRPWADIDHQLRQLAQNPTGGDVPLRPIRTRTAAAIGWNHLIETAVNSNRQGNLEKRVAEAVQGLWRQKADDILNSLSDGVIVTDDESRVAFVNRAAAALLDPSGEPEALTGRTMQDCLRLEDHSSPLVDARFGARTVAVEIKLQEEHVLRVVRNPLRLGDRKAHAGHVWSVRDITQQKLAEKMRDEFLDSATHELRTPLANIKAYAETLTLSDMIDVEEQKQFINTINTEATRLARFIDDLLQVSSMEAGSLTLAQQEVDLERLLREAVEKVRPQMDQKEITFETVFPAKLPKLLLDKDKFVAALVNLLGNAAKYTPDAGRVVLLVKEVGEQLQIEVQDTGMGISETELPKIFNKFFRSSDPRVQKITGTGLGLSFTQEVVRLHGGSLTVQSELDKGSTFTMTFPLPRKKDL